MATEIDSIIQEQYKKLPQIIQDTIINSNWQEKIRRVVKNNNLHVDQGAAIENLVLITMLGIETPEHFVENAKEFAGVDEDTAYTVSNEVEREIFGDIRKKLISISESSGTIAEIDQATNELNKVSEDIEDTVRLQNKSSLKQKIPVDYFEKNSKPSPLIQALGIKEEVEKAPEIKPEILKELESELAEVTEQVATKISDVPLPEEKLKPSEKPIFIPMPKSVDKNDLATKGVSSESSKNDPYRESVV